LLSCPLKLCTSCIWLSFLCTTLMAKEIERDKGRFDGEFVYKGQTTRGCGLRGRKAGLRSPALFPARAISNLIRPGDVAGFHRRDRTAYQFLDGIGGLDLFAFGEVLTGVEGRLRLFENRQV
jgi:hypothetical protein